MGASALRRPAGWARDAFFVWGLAIVKELTEAMAGTVTVTSHTGEGTSFAITLPDPHAKGVRSP
jgi:K+-sensing histidine kinase KdpD